jgi:hypothetical protein
MLKEASRLRGDGDNKGADKKVAEAFEVTPTGASSSPQPTMPNSINVPPNGIHDRIFRPTATHASATYTLPC